MHDCQRIVRVGWQAVKMVDALNVVWHGVVVAEFPFIAPLHFAQPHTGHFFVDIVWWRWFDSGKEWHGLP